LTYYGDQQSWAPEVRSHRIYSKASDVYSVGCIFAKMVKMVWDKAAATSGKRSYLVPKQILDLIKRCTQPDPRKRPEIDYLTGDIEDIEFENVGNIDNLLSQIVQVDIESLLEEELKEVAADPEIPE
jgi:serine/threonine protein kinase